MPTGYSITWNRPAAVGVRPAALGEPPPGVEVGHVGVAHLAVAGLVAGPVACSRTGRGGPRESAKTTANSASSTRTGVHHGCGRPCRPDRTPDHLAQRAWRPGRSASARPGARTGRPGLGRSRAGRVRRGAASARGRGVAATVAATGGCAVRRGRRPPGSRARGPATRSAGRHRRRSSSSAWAGRRRDRRRRRGVRRVAARRARRRRRTPGAGSSRRRCPRGPRPSPPPRCGSGSRHRSSVGR